MDIPKITLQQLLEAGVHLGHKTLRWNPKMKPYIFGSKNSVHIIDLTQTIELINTGLVKVYEIIKKWWSHSFRFNQKTSIRIYCKFG